MEKFQWIKEGANKEELNKIVSGLDFDQNNDDNIKEDAEDAKTREIIGKPEDEEASNRLARILKAGEDFQEKERDYLISLENRLYDINSVLNNIKDLKSSLEVLKHDKKKLEKQSLQELIANNISEYEENQEFLNEIKKLDKDISFYENRLLEINKESDKKEFLESQKEKIEDMISKIDQLLNPQNPSLN